MREGLAFVRLDESKYVLERNTSKRNIKRMKKFRHIGLLKILPEYLLLFGLIFGGFSVAGSLGESYITHAEVAYIELLSQEHHETEEVFLDLEITPQPIKIPSCFYTFAFLSPNQSFLIHHFQAKEKIRYLEDLLSFLPPPGKFYLQPIHILYPSEDIVPAISA